MADEPVKPGQETPAAKMRISLGDSGLKAYGGFINEEFLRELSGDKGLRVYREMGENDATIAAILEVFCSLIGAAPWSFAAADDSEEAEAVKVFAEEVLADMDTPLSDVIAEACTMFQFGFAALEKIYKQRNGWAAENKKQRSRFEDGKIGLASLSMRAQNTISRWCYSDEGELLGFWQQSTWKSLVYIPIDKVALFRTTSVKNSPIGRSVLRRAYRAWYFKSKMEEIEAIGVERDLAGYPVLRIPAKYMDPSADPADKAFYEQCKRMVSQMRRESREGAVLPSDMYSSDSGGATAQPLVSLQLLTSGGSRTFDTTGIIGRYDRAMAMAVLMDFLFLGQGAIGSWALSSDKTSLSANAMGNYLRRMEDVLNTQVFEPLFEINGIEPKLMPKIKAGDLEKPDLAQLGGFVASLTAAGMPLFPDRDVENFLRKAAGLPLAPEEGIEDRGAPGMEDDGAGWELDAKQPDAGSPGEDLARGDALKRIKALLGAPKKAAA